MTGLILTFYVLQLGKQYHKVFKTLQGYPNKPKINNLLIELRLISLQSIGI